MLIGWRSRIWIWLWVSVMASCAADQKTGVWQRLRSESIMLDSIQLEIVEDVPSSQTAIEQVDLVFEQTKTIDTWILILVGETYRSSQLRIVGRGYRNGVEVASGEVSGITFTRNKIVDSSLILELDHSGEDADQDGFYTPEDCDDNDPDVFPGQVESCDQKDNDCDTSIDENCPCSGGSRSCWPDWLSEPTGGRCTKGEQVCQSGLWSACVGLILPGREQCDDGGTTCVECLNGEDDDCDSLIDAKDNGCGGCIVGDWSDCYTGPLGTMNVGRCKEGQSECLDGQWGECQFEILPHAYDGTAGSAAEESLCNNLDDDCDGLTDNVTVFPACSSQCGVCAGTQQVCLNGTWVDCDDQDYLLHAINSLCQGEPTPLCCDENPQTCYVNRENTQLCDGLDNDCNCLPDDAEDGECRCDTGTTIGCPQVEQPVQGACVAGVYHCVEGQWIKDDVCVEPMPESCDNIDNDCDGITDRSPSAGQHCLENLQANAQLEGCFDGICHWACAQNEDDRQTAWDLDNDRNQPGGSDLGNGCEYLCQLSEPADERCDGIDNDCDGLTDGADTQSINVLCPARPNAQANTCNAPQDCDYSCLPNYDDCNGPDVDLPVPLPGESYQGDGCEIYLRNNSFHCGQCNLACDEFEECVAGVCSCAGVGPDCTWPQICCLENCVNSQTDNNHCGECGNSCGQNASCLDGVCTCGVGFADCDEIAGCESPLGTVSNCADCADACGDNTDCVANNCVCEDNYADCDGGTLGCETALGTESNCADCGDACGVNMNCVANNCECKDNYADCDAGTLGCEVDPTVDPDHCGGCYQTCPNEQSCNVSVCHCSAMLADCDRDGVCECDFITHACSGSTCVEL